MRKTKSDFSPSPAKGTKARNFLLAALNPRGITPAELGNYSPHIERLMDDCGLDVRSFPSYDKSRGSRVVYRLVGKMKWDGSYRSFI